MKLGAAAYFWFSVIALAALVSSRISAVQAAPPLHRRQLRQSASSVLGTCASQLDIAELVRRSCPHSSPYKCTRPCAQGLTAVRSLCFAGAYRPGGPLLLLQCMPHHSAVSPESLCTIPRSWDANARWNSRWKAPTAPLRKRHPLRGCERWQLRAFPRQHGEQHCLALQRRIQNTGGLHVFHLPKASYETLPWLQCCTLPGLPAGGRPSRQPCSDG